MLLLLVSLNWLIRNNNYTHWFLKDLCYVSVTLCDISKNFAKGPYVSYNVMFMLQCNAPHCGPDHLLVGEVIKPSKNLW